MLQGVLSQSAVTHVSCMVRFQMSTQPGLHVESSTLLCC